MSASIELKLLEKIRKVLIADATIKGYVSDRVYASHISSINDPVYPAISETIISSPPRTEVLGMADITVQVDLWFKASESEIDTVLECAKRVRDLLHLQELTDSDIGITVGKVRETSAGPMLHEEDTGLYHWPVRYTAVCYD